MVYSNKVIKLSRVEKVKALLVPIQGLFPCPKSCTEFNGLRLLHCPSYDRCLTLATVSSWSGMTCKMCPVYEKFGPDIHRVGQVLMMNHIIDSRKTGDTPEGDVKRASGWCRKKSNKKLPKTLVSTCLLLLGLLGSCATQNSKESVSFVLPSTHYVEQEKLPPDPESERLPPETPKGDWTEALEQGSCLDAMGKPTTKDLKTCPSRSGILISDERAARLVLIKSRYRELRAIFEADRTIWKAHRDLYETQLKVAEKTLKSYQPSWFKQHLFEIGLLSGVVAGVAITFSTFELAKAISK